MIIPVVPSMHRLLLSYWSKIQSNSDFQTFFEEFIFRGARSLAIADLYHFVDSTASPYTVLFGACKVLS